MKTKLIPVPDAKERLALFLKLRAKGIRLNYRPTTEQLRILAR